MKKTILLLGILLLVHGIAATTVKLEADRDELNINETIELHLEIDIEKPIGGRLVVYREIEPNRFTAEVLYTKASPAQCSACIGSTPLTEDLSRNFYFTSEYPGNYYAEANFDGIRKRVNFTVLGNRTMTTTSLTSSTSISSTIPTTVESTSTITVPTTTMPITTTTLQATTSIIPVEEEESILDQILEFLSGLIQGLI